jgi:putative transposase
MSDTVLRMPRIQRSALPAGVFHVTSRGLRRQKIFLDHYDYEYFERDLRQTTSDFEWTLVTYCLMRNHFHLLIETQP